MQTQESKSSSFDQLGSVINVTPADAEDMGLTPETAETAISYEDAIEAAIKE
jgi:hypothetical protein